MTGFGRAEASTELGRLIIEVSSLNRKYVDIHVQLPKELLLFEIDIRSWVLEKITRGQISLHYTLYPESLVPDVAVLKKLKEGWEELAKKLGKDTKEISLSFLYLEMQRVCQPDIPKGMKALLKKYTQQALQDLLSMKVKEGELLQKDIKKRLLKIKEWVSLIEKETPEALQQLRKQMETKISRLFPDLSDNEDRVFREIAMYAERLDIDEEITRFSSHYEQLLSLLKGTEGVVGRKIDFILQELMRESNTIGSKCQNTLVSKIVVDIKVELEKIREQIQNIE